MKLNYYKMLDKIGNSMGIVPVHLSRSSMVKDAISTGSLVCDLIIGGGWPIGRWVALFGPEASGKSTLLYHTLSDAIRKNVNTEFFDFEGSTCPLYLSKILDMDLNNVFGLRKPGGTWEITPQCRYHQPDLGETYFRYMHRILKELPDKLQHDNRWFYVYDKKPKDTTFDKKLYRATKRYWIEAEDSGAQVIWFIDSLPAMLPEKRDEKDENKELGVQARMFSQYIPLVKSRLARKRCSIVAVNQIRLKPMAFGNPEYEVGGEAPKFYCMAEDTYIQTDKGLITAKEAYFNKPNKILGKENLEKPNMYNYMGKSETIKITTDYGFELKGKPGHKVLSLNKHNILEWTSLSDTTKKHYVPVKAGADIWSKDIPVFNFKFTLNNQDYSSKKVEIPSILTKELARLLGYLLAEGSAKENKRNYHITFTKGDTEVMNDFCRCFAYLFPDVIYVIKPHSSVNTKIFEINNIWIFKFLEYLGLVHPAREKTIPKCILESPKEFVIEFLIGYFTGDLSISEKEAKISSASRELLKQTQLVLLNMGILSKRENYECTYFSPLDERKKYASLSIYGKDLCKLTDNIKLVSKKGKITVAEKESWIYKRVPILAFWDDRRLFKSWIKKYIHNNKYFYKEYLTDNALKDLENSVKKTDRKSISRSLCCARKSISRFQLSLDIVSSIKKILNYMDNNIYFLKVEDIKHSSELTHTFDANMPNSTIVTNGIISHNSDIRLQCRSCSNIYGTGQVVEEPCWDNIGVDKYRYIKIATRKNKCFSPFRNSVMRIWMEEKGDTGRGLDPVFDTYQFLLETGQLDEKSHGKKMVIKLEGLWTQRMWSWQEFKELILNPSKTDVYEKYELNDPEIGKISEDNVKDLANVDLKKDNIEDLKKEVGKTLEDIEKILADKLNLRKRCKEQIRNDSAFELYFKAISGIGDSPAKEPDNTCGNCAHFHKSEDCMLVEENTDGCEQWMSEEDEEEMLKEEES